jgi:hypothetical protein
VVVTWKLRLLTIASALAMFVAFAIAAGADEWS